MKNIFKIQKDMSLTKISITQNAQRMMQRYLEFLFLFIFKE